MPYSAIVKTAEFSGSSLETLRSRRRLTQHDLASALRRHGFGTTQATVSRWESGQQEPHSSVLPALAVELECSIADLYVDPSDDDEEEATVPMTLDEYLRHRVRQIVAEELSQL